MFNLFQKIINSGSFLHPKVKAYYLGFQEIETIMGPRKKGFGRDRNQEGQRLSLAPGLFSRVPELA